MDFFEATIELFFPFFVEAFFEAFFTVFTVFFADFAVFFEDSAITSIYILFRLCRENLPETICTGKIYIDTTEGFSLYCHHV